MIQQFLTKYQHYNEKDKHFSKWLGNWTHVHQRMTLPPILLIHTKIN